MKEELVQKISIQLYTIQIELSELLEQTTQEEHKKLLKNKIADIKKIDATILKETKVTFTEKQKKEALKWAKILK